MGTGPSVKEGKIDTYVFSHLPHSVIHDIIKGWNKVLLRQKGQTEFL